MRRLLVGVLRHPPTTFPLESVLTLAAYRQATRNSYRQWRYHMLLVYNYVLLKMSTWCSKHVEENSVLWINNNQCIKLVINVWSIHDARSEKTLVFSLCLFNTSSSNIQRWIVQFVLGKDAEGRGWDLTWGNIPARYLSLLVSYSQLIYLFIYWVIK